MSIPITSISITDVRTLSGEQRVNLSRITLLVGENSVGKSTFLGCLYALGRLAGLDELDDHTSFFQDEPFCMGSFESIARSGCTSFRVGIGLDTGPFRRFAVRFAKNDDTSLEETELKIQLSDSAPPPGPTLTIVRETPDRRPARWQITGPAFQLPLNQSEVSDTQFTTWLSRSIARGVLPFSGDHREFQKRVDNTTFDDLVAFTKFANFFRHQFRIPELPLQIRSIRPRGLQRKRQYPYNPVDTLGGRTDLSAISDAGRKLGLFDRIDVRRLPGYQHEVLVGVFGSHYILCDVGHGISGLLPFIAALGSAPPDTLFLLRFTHYCIFLRRP